MTNFGNMLFGTIILVLGFWGGMAWEKFQYEDWCLDMGGGKNPGNYKYCVVQVPMDNEGKIIENNSEVMIPVESNNGIGDGAESLDELLKKDSKKEIEVCDENLNKYKTQEDAEKAGLEDGEFGATYCPEYKMHSSWDANNDGINDCYEDLENKCNPKVDYASPRTSE